MDNLTVDGWCKQSNAENATPLEDIRFYISPTCHLALEAAEEELLKTQMPEKFVDMDLDALELKLPSEVGHLSDCQFRVYLGPLDNRGQFHIVGHRASDNALIYSNPVMVDQLG